MDKLAELEKELEDTRNRMSLLCWQSSTYRYLRDYELSLMRDIRKLEEEREQQQEAR